MFFYANLLYTHIEWLNRVNWLLINKYAAVKNKRPKTIPNSKVIFEGKWAEKIAISLSVSVSWLGAVLKMYYEKAFCLLWAFKRKVLQKSDRFFLPSMHIVYRVCMTNMCVCITCVTMHVYPGTICTYIYSRVCDAAIDSRQQSKINMHQRAARTAVNMLAVLRFWSSHSHATRNRHDMPLISSARPPTATPTWLLLLLHGCYMAACSHSHRERERDTSLHSAANWITTFSICCIFYTVIKLNLQRASSKTF